MSTVLRRGEAPPLWTAEECTQIVAKAKESSSEIAVLLKRSSFCLETLPKVEQVYAESQGHLRKLREVALLFYHASFGFTPVEQPALFKALLSVVSLSEGQEKELSSRLEKMRRENSRSFSDRVSASLAPGRPERELFLFGILFAFGFLIYRSTLYIYT